MTQMEPTIFKFIWRYSKRQQLMMLGLTVASWPILYYTLELPKVIINQVIGPGSGGAQAVPIYGMQFETITALIGLCVIFLVLVLISGGIKYFINVFRGRLGERMLRRLRYQLYARLLRFPLPHFKKVAPGEIIPMITAEVEPVGGFIGDSIALPAFQGGMLLVYLGFIFAQDPFLGAAAIALYPVQIWLIPKLQKRVNQLAKQRVRTVRQLADRIGDTISGVQEVHAHDTSRLERADIATRLGKIFDISCDRARDHARRAGCGHRGLQGSRLAVEGAAQLLPAEGRREDQIRAGDRAVPAAGDPRRRAAGPARGQHRKAGR
ncbi:MAG: ABC transporter ATP-binding protein [Alphaproteobacteria bacterium]